MVVDGVVVSKVNFSNQHLRLLQAPSSLMKYKNETNVGPIYLSIIDIWSYLWNISLGYGKSLEGMNQQQSSEDPLVFEEEADQKKKQNKKTGILWLLLELPFSFMFNPSMNRS